MQSEEWSIARETLQDALKLEPWSTPLLYRLSACYERERNYIEACDIMQHAMQLTPYDEREPYRLQLCATYRAIKRHEGKHES
jgi:tetratricopeptide (TPR) repeat protein